VLQFRSPKRTLGGIDTEIAAKLLAASSDIALVIDKGGIIRDLAAEGDDLVSEGVESWIGQRWVETVTVESRPKLEDMLREAQSDSPPRWRQINHNSSQGGQVPMRYSAVPLGRSGRVVAMGRDLRPVAALQQRLMEAQGQVEREYSRLRQVETRYRALFQLSTEAVIIADAASLRIVEANPSALSLLSNGGPRITGRPLLELFDPSVAAQVQALLASVRGSPRSDDAIVPLSGGQDRVRVAASLFRHEGTAHFLIRLMSQSDRDGGGHHLDRPISLTAQVMEALPDGFVVIDDQRRVLTVNGAFLELVQLAAEGQVKGQPIDRWLGRVAVDVDVLIASMKENGSVRRFQSVMRGEYGSTEDIEISGVSVASGDLPCYGLTVRKIDRVDPGHPRQARALTRSVEQLTGLVGRMPLKDLVRETTDIVERLCIEAALELTDDNRASAAEILGLSRQSLYVKLRRYGLGDLESDGPG
jgi:transcriptional regulator PpsR